MKPSKLGLLIVAASLAVPAGAHHSASMFEPAKEVILHGTVKGVQITNPHSWIQLLVPGPGGASTEWSVEMANPGTLIRQGFRRSSVAVADKVTITVRPLIDGRPGGLLVSLTLPSGEVLPKPVPAAI